MQELKQKQKENLQSILVHTQTHIQSENIKKLAGGIVVASTGLTKWFKEKWVDIGRPKKKGKYQPCGRGKAKTSRKGYPKCVPLARAKTMSKAQRKSAVRRKRAVKQGVRGKPTNVRTVARRKKTKRTKRSRR